MTPGFLGQKDVDHTDSSLQRLLMRSFDFLVKHGLGELFFDAVSTCDIRTETCFDKYHDSLIVRLKRDVKRNLIITIG